MRGAQRARVLAARARERRARAAADPARRRGGTRSGRRAREVGQRGRRRDGPEPLPVGRRDRDLPRARRCPPRASWSWATRRSPARLRRIGAELGLELVAGGRRAAPIRDAGDLALVVAAHGRDELRCAAPRSRGGRAVRRPRRQPQARRRRDRASCAATAWPRSCSSASTCPPGSTSARARRRDRAVDPGEDRRGAPRARPPVRRGRLRSAPLAVDPICGMTVAAVPSTLSLERDGETFYFCCEGCKAEFEAQQRACPPRRLSRSSPDSCWAPAARSASGRPKQLLPYGDGTLLGHVVGVARACPFDADVVAIGGSADEVRAGVDLAGADVVVNDAYGAGCSSSIAAALAVVDPRCDVLVLMLGDQPGVTADDGRDAAGRPRRCAARRLPLRRRARATRSRSPAACSPRSPTSTATRACGACSTSAPPRWRRCRSPGRSRSTSTPRRTTRRSLDALAAA